MGRAGTSIAAFPGIPGHERQKAIDLIRLRCSDIENEVRVVDVRQGSVSNERGALQPGGVVPQRQVLPVHLHCLPYQPSVHAVGRRGLLFFPGTPLSGAADHEEVRDVPGVGRCLTALPFALLISGRTALLLVLFLGRRRGHPAVRFPQVPQYLDGPHPRFFFELPIPSQRAAPDNKLQRTGSFRLRALRSRFGVHLSRGPRMRGGYAGRSHHDQPDVSSVALSSLSHSMAPRQLRKSRAFCGMLPINQRAVAFIPTGTISACATRPSRFLSRHSTVGSE